MQAAADQGHFGFTAGLQVARLHRQQTTGALLGGDEIEAALIVLGFEHPALQFTAFGGEHLTHGHSVDGHVAAPFVAAVEDGATVTLERAAIGVLAFDRNLELINAGGADAHHTSQFALARQVAAEAPVAHQGIGLGCGFLPVLPGGVVQCVALGQQRHHLLAGDVEPVAVARQGLVLQGRPLAEVEVHQAFPLLGRPTLQGDPRTGVAAAAHLAGLLVELLDGVEPTFQCIAHAVGFARCQALGIGEVLDQRTTVFIADLQAVHDLHAGNAHQPAFGGLALVTDTAQGIVGFRGMTALAGFLEDGLGVSRRKAGRGMQGGTDGQR
ncbi:hypothetical protein D3C78_409450 [compost metagenome]